MPNKPAIKTVFFDVGNVLLRFDRKAIAAKFAWALRRNPVAIAKYIWTNESVVDRIEDGTLKPIEIYQGFRDKLGFTGSYAAFCRLWCDHFTLDRGVASLLKRVRRTRKVYLLSNTNDLHYTFIYKRYSFPRQVDGAILSYKVGMRKPQPDIYRHALKLSGTRPQESLLIDDLPENVAGAAKVGMRVLLHTDAATLRAALADLGLI